jgi:hypothetical protein
MNDLSLYNSVRQSMSTGDMLGWKSYSLIGKAIRLRTVPPETPEDSPLNINHISGVIRLKEYEGLDRRVFITEALEHGAVLNLLSRRLESFDGAVWWYPLLETWNPVRVSIGEQALSFIGIPYDYEAIVAQLFGSVSVDVKSLFCSEYYYRSLGFSECEAPNPYEMASKEYFGTPVRIL